MSGTAGPAVAGRQVRASGQGRGGIVLAVLAAVTVVLAAVQFALAGFGAFAMDDNPSDTTSYNAHVVLGLITAVLTVLILAAVLATRSAREHRPTLWTAIILAVLTAAGQPLLGEGAKHVPAVGALHALNGLAIFILASWLAWQANPRRTTHGPDQP